MLTLQIHGFTPEQVLEMLMRARESLGSSESFPLFNRLVRGLSSALERQEVKTRDNGSEVCIQGEWPQDTIKEIADIISRECASRVFVVPLIPSESRGDVTIVISPPVTQGRTGQLTGQEAVQIAHIAGEAHSWDEAIRVADRLTPYWPIMGWRSTPFVRVVKTDADLKLPDFYDVVRAAVALQFVEDAPAIAFHLGGQSNAAATYFLRALVASGQEELARMFGEIYGGRVIVDSSVIAQYRNYMPSIIVKTQEETAMWHRYARTAMLAINLLYAWGRIGDIDLPPASPIESNREIANYMKLLRAFCSLYTQPKKQKVDDDNDPFDIESVVNAATRILGHYLYFCQTHRLPPFPMAVFRSQFPSAPSMVRSVWSLMSPNDQMSLLSAARKKCPEVSVSTQQEIKISQIAMAASSQDREVQIEALRKALERLDVILVVDISGSMERAISIAREITRRFMAASGDCIKTILFGDGKVEVHGSLPYSLVPRGDTPGEPAVLVCAEWARQIIASGKRGVCSILITDCEFNREDADVFFGQGAYLQSGTAKKVRVSPDDLVEVAGLYFVVVHLGRLDIPEAVSLLGEDVLVVQERGEGVDTIVANTIKAILEVSNRMRRAAISWTISGNFPGIDYVKEQYDAVVRGESPIPKVTVEISLVQEQ